jgi:hypothetical protein
MSDPRYPIGRFAPPAEVTPELFARLVCDLEAAPALVRDAVRGLDTGRLSTPYRDGGWTIAQVVHHIPDSHMNAYGRMKMAVTEDEPAIKAYHEDLWAKLPDASDPATIADSLDLLAALHARWVRFLRALEEADLARTYRHPELGTMRVDRVLALYAWHSRHHLAHITGVKERMGW